MKPVSYKKGVADDQLPWQIHVAIPKARVAWKVGEQYTQSDHGEIERPNTKYAAEIKPSQANRAGILSFFQEESRDQETAQDEKQIDTRTAGSDKRRPKCWKGYMMILIKRVVEG